MDILRRNSQRGEIITILTIGAFVVISLLTIATSLFSNKNPQTTKTQASSPNCSTYPIIPPEDGGTPNGYYWQADCNHICTASPECPKNTSEPQVNPDTSNWCYGFGNGAKCMMLHYGTPPITPTPVPTTPPQSTQTPGTPTPASNCVDGAGNRRGPGESYCKGDNNYYYCQPSDNQERMEQNCVTQNAHCGVNPQGNVACLPNPTNQPPPPTTQPQPPIGGQPPPNPPPPGNQTCSQRFDGSAGKGCTACIQRGTGCAWAGPSVGGTCVSAPDNSETTKRPYCDQYHEWHYWSCGTDSRDACSPASAKTCAYTTESACKADVKNTAGCSYERNCWEPNPTSQQPQIPQGVNCIYTVPEWRGKSKCDTAANAVIKCETNNIMSSTLCGSDAECAMNGNEAFCQNKTPDYTKKGSLTINVPNIKFPKDVTASELNKHLKFELFRESVLKSTECSYGIEDGTFQQIKGFDIDKKSVTFENLPYFMTDSAAFSEAGACPHHYYLEVKYYGKTGTFNDNYDDLRKTFYDQNHKFSIPPFQANSDVSKSVNLNDVIDLNPYIHEAIIKVTNNTTASLTINQLTLYDRNYDAFWVKNIDILADPVAISQGGESTINHVVYEWSDAVAMVKVKYKVETMDAGIKNYELFFKDPSNYGDGALTYIINIQ
jgi:hypothetical protein